MRQYTYVATAFATAHQATITYIVLLEVNDHENVTHFFFNILLMKLTSCFFNILLNFFERKAAS